MARAVVVIVTGAVIGILLGAAVWIARDRNDGPAIVIDDPRADATIVVAVNGAVASPGLQRLSGEARYQEAIDAAGGALPEADLSRINPAQRVLDGEQILVPTKIAKPQGTGAARVPSSSGNAQSDTHLVDINSATAAELDALPHIGPVLAQRIVDYRNQHGPFRTVDDLVKVSGISTKIVDDLRSSVTIGP